MSIPLREFGKTGVRISALGLGGHHLGGAKDEKTAIEIVHRALDGGITFYDNAWEYYLGKTESWLGMGLKGRRDKAFVMTKVCTHGRDGSLAMQMLDQSLRRLQTDHLDLWQVHGVVFQNDPELFIRPGGAAEALLKAKQQGKVRFVGFTGHKDPDVHLAMLNTGFPFDSVQMPLNAFDATYFMSFEQKVLPVLNQRGIAPLGMKAISGHGDPVQMGVLTAREALRYAMSLPVACTISGVEGLHILEQNLEIAQNFVPMTPAEMQALRDRCRQYAADGRFELYKASLKFDNPEARLVHEYPLDAKERGKVRFVGFNGHKHPAINLEMLNRGYAFDVVQMPLNPLDPGFRSFENDVLPVANRRGVAVLGMKSMGGSGETIAKGAFAPAEALSYAMSLPVATTISGIDSMVVLDQNLAILRDFKPLSADQMQKLRDHGRQFNDGRYELYKSTLKYDSDLSRSQHGYPSAAELPL